MVKRSPTHVVKHHQLRCPSSIVITNRIERSPPHQRRDELLQEQGQQSSADHCQVKVVNLEQAIQLQWLPLSHNLTSAEDDDVVKHQRRRGLGDGGHGRAAGHEAELLWLVASDFGEGLAEDGPEFDAEWAVQGGRAHFEPGRGGHAGRLCA